jgi:peptidoglycan/xylan/chitin deacetylase (PgdA/CDA1 family)
LTQDLVLTFHGIGTAPPGIPDAERPYWMPTADFLAFLEKAAAEARPLGLRLTASFDDGNRSDLEIAAPALQKLGIAGLFFPCSGRLGKSGYLDAGDLRQIDRMGFGIGSHGVDHLPWASLAAAHLVEELTLSKAVIEAALGHAISAAAMPFGSYNRRVLGGLRRAGYQTVYSSNPGLARPGAFFQRRWSYRQGMDFDLAQLSKVSRDPVKQAVGGFKHLIKSLR